jgi:hypothetical protein
MPEYTLSNSAAIIDSSITRVASADTTPIANSQSMVTSGGVKAALDNLATGNTLTVDSFDASALDDSTDGLSDTDTAIPTCAAVTDFVRSNFTLKPPENLGTSSTSGVTTTITGNTPHDGTIVISYYGAKSKVGRDNPVPVSVTLTAVVDGATYKSQGFINTITIPARIGVPFSITLVLDRTANNVALTISRKFIPFN